MLIFTFFFLRDILRSVFFQTDLILGTPAPPLSPRSPSPTGLELSLPHPKPMVFPLNQVTSTFLTTALERLVAL